ncbi:MAG: hypothetical protein R2708_19455 [Vicinamibacterales bacterium]
MARLAVIEEARAETHELRVHGDVGIVRGLERRQDVAMPPWDRQRLRRGRRTGRDSRQAGIPPAAVAALGRRAGVHGKGEPLLVGGVLVDVGRHQRVPEIARGQGADHRPARGGSQGPGDLGPDVVVGDPAGAPRRPEPGE